MEIIKPGRGGGFHIIEESISFANRIHCIDLFIQQEITVFFIVAQ